MHSDNSVTSSTSNKLHKVLLPTEELKGDESVLVAEKKNGTQDLNKPPVLEVCISIYNDDIFISSWMENEQSP
jgi:hypothetical protein